MLAWTTKDFAQRGIESARLDAELLIADALSLDRVRLYMDLDRPLVEAERARIRERIKRRRAREPVAYIIGRKAFWGRDFEVGPAVLVPRPDTEVLVERALELIEGAARVVDLCTGSGAIGLTLAAERPEAEVDLTDVSAEALAVARANAERFGVAERVRFLEGDLFDALEPGARYDLIVCNPPYVAASEVEELVPEVAEHEPRLALVSGETGFEVHERLVRGAREWLVPGGAILVEVGAGQGAELEERFLAAGMTRARRFADLAGIDRVVEAVAG